MKNGRKIKPEDIAIIKEKRNNGQTPLSLAAEYGVRRDYIYRVLNDKAHVSQARYVDRGHGYRERRLKREMDELCSFS